MKPQVLVQEYPILNFNGGRHYVAKRLLPLWIGALSASKAAIPTHSCVEESSICRKTAGAGGYAINIAGDNTTLEVEGEENITIYRAKIQNPEDPEPRQSEGERRFCSHCGSFL